MKLSPSEGKVLRFLYECKDQKAPTAEEVSAATGLSLAATKQVLTALRERGCISGPVTLAEKCAATLREMEPELSPVSESYAERILLLASLITKADEAFLAQELGYDHDFVSLVGSRLRASGIWQGDQLSQAHEAAWCGEAGGTAFYLDVNVATGDMMIVGGSPDNPTYQVTEAGKKRVSNLVERRDRNEQPDF